MSIDAVAILRIPHLAPPMTPFGVPHPVAHQGDASIVNLMTRYDAARADEHALALRQLLGDALDAHDDPRGILFYPDVMEHPANGGYDALIAAMERHGVWAPVVAAGYVPGRITGAAVGTHDALLGEMIAVMGRDAGPEQDMLAMIALVNLMARPGDAGAAQSLGDALARIAAAMGPDFAGHYEASLRAKVEREIAASFAPPPIALD